MAIPSQVGRYKITGEIGRGAMGAVLRGVDTALERPVAIKIISQRLGPGGTPDAELTARFIREAKLAARINHPGVVTVHDAGEDQGTLYLVMELVEGESVKQRLDRGRYPSREEALRLAADVADALSAAHDLGVVHRDIKPANILLTWDGRVKVTDFGVAKGMGEESGVTRTGATVGSPSYMAPEQVMGKTLDGRADLFSLGVVLYEILLHRRPFPADTITTLVYQILHHDPLADEETLRSLGDETSAFLAWCLAKEAAARVPSASIFAARARELAASVSGVLDATTPMTDVQVLVDSGHLGPDEPTKAVPMPTLPSPRPPAATRPAPARQPVPPPPPAHVAEPTMVAAVPAPRPSRWLLVMGILVVAILAVAVAFLGVWVMHSTSQPEPLAAAATPPPGGLAPVLPAVEPTAGSLAPEPPSGPGAAAALRPSRSPGQAPARALEAGLEARPTPYLRPSPTRLPQVAPTPAQEAVAGQVAAPPTAVFEIPTMRPTQQPQPSPTEPPSVVAEFSCSESAEFHVDPEDVEVAIDGQVIGIADDWDGTGGGKTYVFPGPGTYYVRLSLPPKWRTTFVKIVVSPTATKKTCDVDTELKTVPRRERDQQGGG